MKKALIIVLALVLLAVALTGANKWPAKIWIYNGDSSSTAYFNFEGDEFPVVQFVVGPGESKVFTVAKGDYDGVLTFCGASTPFDMHAGHNLWINLTTCAQMRQVSKTGTYCRVYDNGTPNDPTDDYEKCYKYRPMYLGEPSREKFNRFIGSPQEWWFQSRDARHLRSRPSGSGRVWVTVLRVSVGRQRCTTRRAVNP
jgi:hypothetical protein